MVWCGVVYVCEQLGCLFGRESAARGLKKADEIEEISRVVREGKRLTECLFLPL